MLTVLEVEHNMGRTISYKGMPFRPLRMSEIGSTCRVEGLLYNVAHARWRTWTVSSVDLALEPGPRGGEARESLTWMNIHFHGWHPKRGDECYRVELDAVREFGDDEGAKPDGVVVATRNNRGEVLVAWLVQTPPKRRALRRRKPR